MSRRDRGISMDLQDVFEVTKYAQTIQNIYRTWRRFIKYLIMGTNKFIIKNDNIQDKNVLKQALKQSIITLNEIEIEYETMKNDLTEETLSNFTLGLVGVIENRLMQISETLCEIIISMNIDPMGNPGLVSLLKAVHGEKRKRQSSVKQLNQEFGFGQVNIRSLTHKFKDEIYRVTRGELKYNKSQLHDLLNNVSQHLSVLDDQIITLQQEIQKYKATHSELYDQNYQSLQSRKSMVDRNKTLQSRVAAQRSRGDYYKKQVPKKKSKNWTGKTKGPIQSVKRRK